MGLRSSQLDLLRTLAILLVFTSHFNIFAGHEWFKTVGQFGWIGVDLFFVLSGFLIASQLLKPLMIGRGISLKDFYIRRGFRIWPNFFFVLLIYFAIPGFAEKKSELAPLWKFLTFTQNFGLDHHAQGVFSHAWSLCVEEQFYLFLPFILLIMNRFGNFRASVLFLIFVMLSGVVLRSYLWRHFVEQYYFTSSQKGTQVPFYREIYYPTYCRLDGLAVGVSIAALYRRRPQLWQRVCERANVFLVAGLGLITVALFIVYDEYSFSSASIGFPLIDLGFGFLVVAALSPQGYFSKIRIPGVKACATLAFAFYLTHKQMIHLSKDWILNFGIEEKSVLYPAGIFLACLIVAIALYLLVERPFLILRDRILRGKSSHYKNPEFLSVPVVTVSESDFKFKNALKP